MKRRKLEKHLRRHGCYLHHHGAAHDMWVNPATDAQSAVPRHAVIKIWTANGICTQLGIPKPDGY